VEPFLQAASGRILNPRVSGSAGQPRKGTEGVAAEEGTAKAEARDAVAPSFGGGESLGEVAVVSLRTPGFSRGEAQRVTLISHSPHNCPILNTGLKPKLRRVHQRITALLGAMSLTG